MRKSVKVKIKLVKYYVYILKCADETLYVGSASNLEKRLHSHNHLKSGAHYTKIRRPVKLVYSEMCRTYASVRAREGELKALSRRAKLAIVATNKKRSTGKGAASLQD